MVKRYVSAIVVVGIAALVGFVRFGSNKPMELAEFEALYVAPASAASDPQNVFHLGHSLVGVDMPAMLAQLAGDSHSYGSQLGWGTPLKAHWEPDEPINGFELVNIPNQYTDARDAISSGDYNTLVLTEMVEIRDAIKYFDSSEYLRKWVDLGRQANPDMRIYFYETWHRLDDKEGWLERIDKDLERYWEKEILRRALSDQAPAQPIYVIPAGQVMARFIRTIEDLGGVGPISDRTDIFTDEIHLSDYGAYLIALTHYAALYQKSPVGLPYQLLKADGTNAAALDPETAELMQSIVWDVVQNYPPSGVPQS